MSFAGLIAGALTATDSADADWSGSGTGSGASRAKEMPAGNQPAVSVSGVNITVSWAAGGFAGGGAVDGYLVKRYSLGGAPQTIGDGCAGTIAGLSCTDVGVPAGSWRYTVTPKRSNWLGAESPQSGTAAIAGSLTTTAWSISDVSSGSAQNTSDGFAAAGGPYGYQLTFPTSFDTSRYVAFDFNGPLRSGAATSDVSFNFDYLGYNTALGTAATACFYFDVRRISTGGVLGTHGSAASPVDCNSTLTYDRISTPLPEVTSSDVANDLEVRVYMNNSVTTNANFEDRANITGAVGADSFTLYENQVIDRASGISTVKPWALATAGDGALYTSASGWDTSFNSSKYLSLTFPAYVPSGSTGISGTFKYSYKANSAGETNCWYFAVYQGTTLLANHGSASSPVSCAGSVSLVTDTVSLPEVNSVARANNLVVRVYAKNTGTTSKRKSDTDLATVKIDYTP